MRDMAARFSKFALPAAAFFVVAIIIALTAGIAYGVVALLVGLVVIGGLAAGVTVAEADDDSAPFQPDDSTPAGDTREHSDETSAVSHTPH
jgi:hypothetical protein